MNIFSKFRLWKANVLGARRTRVLATFETVRRRLHTLDTQLETEKGNLLKSAETEALKLKARVAEIESRIAAHKTAHAALSAEQKAIAHTSAKISEILGA